MAQLEAEATQLRETVINKQTVVKSLERRVSNLEVEVQELHVKVSLMCRACSQPGTAPDKLHALCGHPCSCV